MPTPTLPRLEIDNLLSNGVIPTKFLFADLPVKIMLPWRFLPLVGESDFITFIWHVLGSVPFELPPIELPGPLTSSDFPLTVSIPQAFFLNNAVVDISYRINNLFEDSAVFEVSDPRRVSIDRSAPGGNAVLEAARFLVNPITEFDLTSAATTGVEVRGDYLDRKAFDRLLGYLSSTNTLPTRPPIHEQAFAASTGPMVMNIPVAEIRKFSAFPIIYFFYRVIDLAGNVSIQYSEVASADLLLTAPVTNLTVPEVPAFDSDLLVKRDDARLIVSVRVRHYDNWMPGDQCVVHWGTVRFAPQTVTALPQSFNVDWPTLIANGSDRQRINSVPVRYFIRRAGDLVGPGAPSPLRLVDVDNTIAGQENPVAPALRNNLLSLVSVFGAVSNTQNRLDNRDANQPVRASFRLFDAPKPGESASLFWPGQSAPVATYTVKAGDIGGAVVDFDNRIPWAAIQAGGSNANTLVNYRTDNGVNQQLSPDQSVFVSLAPLINFPRPTFPQSMQHPNKFLNCATKPPIWQGVQVLVSPAANSVMAGDNIIVTWQGFLNYPNVNPIASTAHTISYTWAVTDLTHLFLVLDYQNLIRPLSDYAGATAIYSVFRNGILVGTSAIAYVQIDRKYGSGNYCGPNGIGPNEK